MRRAEGARLRLVVIDKLDQIRDRVGELEALRPQAQAALVESFESRLEELLGNGEMEPGRLEQEVAVLIDHTQGCSPLGPVHDLTEVHRNIAVKLDGRPALEVLREDVGEVIARDLQRIGGYIFAALPVAHTDTGDYLVRNLVGLDPQRGLVAVGDDLEGQEQLLFCRRDGNTARADLERMLERLARRTAGRTLRGGVYISCVGRGRHQFGDHSEELVAIRDALGAFPLVGFFADGEIYHGRLYGYTGVLTLFVD